VAGHRRFSWPRRGERSASAHTDARVGGRRLFAFSVWAIGYYFGETIGTPLVLLVAGVVLLAMAFVAARLRGLTSERSSPPLKPRV
jgi:ABC-type xylose transport system permease subunit